MKNIFKYSLYAACLNVAFVGSQHAAAANLIVNGDFSSINGDIINQQIGVAHPLVAGGVTALVNGWVSGTSASPLTPAEGSDARLNFIFGPGDAGTIGAVSRYTPGDNLFPPFTTSASGVTNDTRMTLYTGVGADLLPTSSPNGGNYLALDGSADVGPISQQLTGLVLGGTYELSFYWAAAQQKGYSAANGLTEQFVVSLGGQTISTPVVSYPEFNFVPWSQVKMTFTADSVNPILSFLSKGTPDGLPPFALLDGVSLEAVPEPSSCFIGAFALVGLALRRRRSVVTL
jgi:hypothetical protein